MNKSLQLCLLSGLAVISIYVTLVFGEFISNMNAYQYLRNDVNVPVTLLRMCVMAMTVCPVAYFIGRIILYCSPTSGRTALIGIALSIAIIIGLLEIFVYDHDSYMAYLASLNKVIFTAAGLWLVAYRYPLVHEEQKV